MDDQLAAIQQAINVLHQLMTTLSDPSDVRVVAQCLSALTNIQKMHMQQQQGGGAVQGLVSQLAGGGGGGQGG